MSSQGVSEEDHKVNVEDLMEENQRLREENQQLKEEIKVNLIRTLVEDERVVNWSNDMLCSYVRALKWLPQQKRESLTTQFMQEVDDMNGELMDGGGFLGVMEFPNDMDDKVWFHSFTIAEKKQFWNELNNLKKMDAEINGEAVRVYSYP